MFDRPYRWRWLYLAAILVVLGAIADKAALNRGTASTARCHGREGRAHLLYVKNATAAVIAAVVIAAMPGPAGPPMASTNAKVLDKIAQNAPPQTPPTTARSRQAITRPINSPTATAAVSLAASGK
jgi:hypothetical protein